MKEKYYISTAIAYTSGKPHIGNTYEVILADAIARYKKLRGYDVYFQTGTDEHGEKIKNRAKDANKTPQEYVDEIAGEIKDIWDMVDAKYDKFVRTTDPSHKKQVQEIFKKLYDNGEIYKGVYEGLYCESCESFYAESQIEDGKCPEGHKNVYLMKEEAYFLKIKKYEEKLRKYIEENEDFVIPASRKNEILNTFFQNGLQDLCISRSSFDWGIPVPIDEKNIIYVWLDALSNYITFLGFLEEDKSMFEKYWPCDLHLIGKDILRFHVIYWPVILMGLGVELPKSILGHPWVLMGKDKMSKSFGNILYADELVEEFGKDELRFYLLHEIPFANDGTLTKELLIERVNTELANNMGNLINRTLTMVSKYNDGKIVKVSNFDEEDLNFQKEIINLKKEYENKMDQYRIAEGFDIVFDIFRKSNKYIDQTTPWLLTKENKQEKLNAVLYNLVEAIRHGAILISPFIPETSEKILNQINSLNNKDYESLDTFTNLAENLEMNEFSPLFNRIEKIEE